MHWGVGGLGSIIKIVKRTKKTADTYKNQPSAKIPTLAKEHVIVLSKSSSKLRLCLRTFINCGMPKSLSVFY